MTTQELLTNPQITELHSPQPPETLITPELIEAVDAAFTDQVETLENISLSPEQENTMGVSNKPNISTDHHLGARS